MNPPLVRSIHRGGPGTLRVTAFYPADPAMVDDARLTGVVAPQAGPFPLVVFLPGINVTSDAYRWLAGELAGAGHVVAIPSVIDDLGPAGTGISPGIDLMALAPDVAGTRPSASALADAVALVVDDPLLGPVVERGRIVLGGHSAGGTVVLHNARPDWFGGVCGAFTYAGHTVTSTQLGHEEMAVTEIPSSTPLLLLAGAADGVIAASRDRYRSDDGDHDPVWLTFRRGITSDRGDCRYVELADGTHFTPCRPLDRTSGRTFLEPADPPGQEVTRRLLADLVLAFLDASLGRADGAALDELASGDGVSRTAVR